MLDLDRVDLGDLCVALEDNSPEHSWRIDARTGELDLRTIDSDEAGDPEERHFVAVEPLASSESYGDMEDFAERVPDPRARDLLARAIAGRGAFRRFKDTLLEFPELRDAWFAFHDTRMERRAIEWLRLEGMVSDEQAATAIAARADGEPAPQVELNAHAVATAVARDLADLYGQRLKGVVLFGSWARGDAHAESDIDLLVVLDRVTSRRRELKRMSDVLWRHSLANDTVVTEIPVSELEYRRADEPLLVRARAEGVRIA